MKHEDIIACKIDYVNGTSSEDITDEMKVIIESDAELKSEIEFISVIWDKNSEDTSLSPSPHMQARFYQMLSQAQSAQPSEKVQTKARFGFGNLFSWLQPAFQMVFVITIFSGGYLVNQMSSESTNPTVALENKIDTLNVMVAMTMLKNDSALERLAGVNYAKSSGAMTPELTNMMVALLNTDQSNAVRLSVVDILSRQSNINQFQNTLVASLSKQSNVIVQVALSSLLQQNGTLSKQQLQIIRMNEELDEAIIKQLLKPNAIENTDNFSA